MSNVKVSQHGRSLLDDLRHAVHGLQATFACGGTLVPDQPVTFCFDDRTEFSVVRAPQLPEQEKLLHQRAPVLRGL